VNVHHMRAILLLVLSLVTAGVAAREFMSMWEPDEIRPSPFLTDSLRLSVYCPSLSGTPTDATVYDFNSHVPGATVLVLGGTHPNEPAGFMTAVLLVENLHVRMGRIIVIPQACLSGFTCTDPLEGSPQTFAVPTANSARVFRFGGRGANVVDQWPDPLVFLQYPSGQQLSGNETRNLNRAYPGRPDGTLTERNAFAILEIIRREGVNLAVDLHEAAPEIPIINAIVTHEKGREIAAGAVLALEFDDLQYSLEMSPPNFRGLSHREWGDRTDVLPFLMETSNPIQGRLRGRTSDELVVKGVDPWYAIAAQLGTMRITYELDGEPLARRVGRHVQGLRALMEAYNEQHADAPVVAEGIPSYAEIVGRGVGSFLQ
jgi:hypothetical protein